MADNLNSYEMTESRPKETEHFECENPSDIELRMTFPNDGQPSGADQRDDQVGYIWPQEAYWPALFRRVNRLRVITMKHEAKKTIFDAIFGRQFFVTVA